MQWVHRQLAFLNSSSPQAASPGKLVGSGLTMVQVLYISRSIVAPNAFASPFLADNV